MNPLHLQGWGVAIRVNGIRDKSELQIIDRNRTRLHVFRPRKMLYDSVVIESRSGYISLQSLHWLSRNNVPVYIMNYDGAIISQILPPIPIKADLRKAQFQASDNAEKKFTIAKALVQAKIQRSLEVLDWLRERYDIEREMQITKHEASKLPKASTVTRLRTVEGRVALRHWEAYRKTMPERLRFQGRMSDGHNMNTSDPINLALNYAYGYLKCECRTAVNSVGLEPAIGFLHEPTSQQTRESLIYDLQEPFRFLCDLAVVQSFETGKLDTGSFYFAEQDYSYHFEPEAKGRILDALRHQFNAEVKYKGRKMTWAFLIREKAVELGRYLKGSTPTIDFNEPSFNLARMNGKAKREAILSMTSTEARERGIGKSQLHYLRRKAMGERSFKLYAKTKQKLERT